MSAKVSILKRGGWLTICGRDSSIPKITLEYTTQKKDSLSLQITLWRQSMQSMVSRTHSRLLIDSSDWMRCSTRSLRKKVTLMSKIWSMDSLTQSIYKPNYLLNTSSKMLKKDLSPHSILYSSLMKWRNLRWEMQFKIPSNFWKNGTLLSRWIKFRHQST